MIVESIIDTDLYKLTMQKAVCSKYPSAYVSYLFHNRGGTKFPDGFDVELRKEITNMSLLSLTVKEKTFLKEKCPYLGEFYLDFLQGYRFKPEEVGVTQVNGDLTISISGLWYRTILWEVPLMAIISELYFKMTKQEPQPYNERLDKNLTKAGTFQNKACKVGDFGTRRRFSYQNQLEVVGTFVDSYDSDEWFTGTSNPYIAMQLGLTPLGTFAHEWVSGIAALEGYTHANAISMEKWSQVYNGDLGIALPDTFGLDSFLVDFGTKYAKLFDGVRHDSGDPFEFTNKIVAHYLKLGIDPLSKTIIFSDALDTELVLRLADHCKEKINCAFGIGTHLTNDVGVKPLNMVIKLNSINQIPCIKLSDNPNKAIGDAGTIQAVKYLISQHVKV